MINKSLATNLTALAIVITGYFSPKYSEIICMTGLFALSGGVTNWLAIHMLFEKVPFFYGSGVIPNQFREFKVGIKRLIMSEFFTRENIEKFMGQHFEMFTTDINNVIDFDRVFDGLVEAIEGSSMGSMLGILGGRKALQPLKEPITLKLQEIILEVKDRKNPMIRDKDLTLTLVDQVEQIIDQRLEELTPGQVKDIIQEMICEHLGWLVVWGGIVGGFIGLGVAIV